MEYTNREEKDWSQYSYERLLSFHDAYEECLNALTQIRDKSTEKEAAIVNETYNAYAEIQADIEQQMVVIRNQLNALYEFYGIYPETDDINAKSYIKHDYSYVTAAVVPFCQSDIRTSAGAAGDWLISDIMTACIICHIF